MRALVRHSAEEWSMEILSPADQAQYDQLLTVLVETLGLDWKTNFGAPNGHEVADDCAAALWDAGFRVAAAKYADATAETTTTTEPEEGA